MRSRVNSYFEENNIKKTGNMRMYLKTFIMLSLYFVPLALILTLDISNGAVLLLFTAMGLGLSGIGLAIMHDANHGSYSKSKVVNQIIGYSLNAVGGSSFTWHIQHNVLHHTYTNIYEMDEDIHDKPFLRLSPHGKHKGYHKFQHWYALGLYSLATISWILMKDIRQLKLYNKNGLTEQSGFKPKQEVVIMAITKISYVFYILVLPMLLGIPWWVVLLGFLLMHMIAGVLITTIFQLAHVVEGPTHHEPHPSGTMENTWAIHQLETTANFAKNNPFISWFVGGLNYQVEHHLFPHICHIHYKHISKIVKATAKEFELPYHENKWFTTAVISHLKTLKEFGKEPKLVEKPVPVLA
ncbi:MAG: linoleoyl-CoA desaturase [Maribacter sp.]|jgi:linoleoyl-CoA desaturase